MSTPSPLHAEFVPQFIKMLGNLDRWLGEAATYAESRDFAITNLLTARLYPDQFDLTRQVQAAADSAKLAGARIAGVDAPKHEDGPATLEELRARIAEVRAFLGRLDAAAFSGREDAKLTPAMLKGQAVTCQNYLREFAIPNFYHHLNMVYAILRTNGVLLGKRGYIGSVQLEPAG